MKKLLATAAVLLALVPTANAQMYKRDGQTSKPAQQGMTFERWYNYCKDADVKTGSPRNSNPSVIANAQFCFGLTFGVAEGATFVVNDANLNTICIPNGVYAKEMVEVGQAFYRGIKDPEAKQKNFQSALAWAFYTVWPCEAKGQPS